MSDFKFEIGEKVRVNIRRLRELEEMGRCLKHNGDEAFKLAHEENRELIIKNKMRINGYDDVYSNKSYEVEGMEGLKGWNNHSYFIVGEKEIQKFMNSVRRLK